MKLTLQILTVAISLYATTHLNAAALPFIFNFDELGHGTININNAGPIGFLGTPFGPPQTFKLIPPLTWMFGNVGLSGLPNGDVVLMDIHGPTDIIRLTDATGALTGNTADRLLYFSGDIAGQTFADSGFPANAGTGTILAGVIQTLPTTTFTINGIYTFTTTPENIPEPATYASIAAGLILLSAISRRRPARSNS